MGLTVLPVEVANPANPDVTEEVDLLIDLGAVYSIISSAILERLGTGPLIEQRFRLANGSTIVRERALLYSRTAIESVEPTLFLENPRITPRSERLPSKPWASHWTRYGGNSDPFQ